MFGKKKKNYASFVFNFGTKKKNVYICTSLILKTNSFCFHKLGLRTVIKIDSKTHTYTHTHTKRERERERIENCFFLQ